MQVPSVCVNKCLNKRISGKTNSYRYYQANGKSGVFWSLHTSQLFLFGELAGGGCVGVAVGVSDR